MHHPSERLTSLHRSLALMDRPPYPHRKDSKPPPLDHPSLLTNPKKKSFKPKNLTLTKTVVLRIPVSGKPKLITLTTTPTFAEYTSDNGSDAHLLHIPNASTFWGGGNNDYFENAWYNRTVMGCFSCQEGEWVQGVYYVLLNKSFWRLKSNEHVASAGGGKESVVYGDAFIFEEKDEGDAKGEIGEAVFEDVGRVFLQSGEGEEMLRFAAEHRVEEEAEYVRGA